MTGAFVLITLGVLLLMNNLYPTRFEFGRMWPVILIVIGVVKIIDYFQRPAPVQGAATAARPPLPPPLPPAPKPASAGSSPGPAEPVQTRAPRQSAGYSGGGSEASKPANKADSEPKDDEGSSSSGSGKED